MKFLALIYLLIMASLPLQAALSSPAYIGKMGNNKKVFGDYTRSQIFNSSDYQLRIVGQITFNNNVHCTATLIGPKHAVTAAHCVYDLENKSFYDFLKFVPGRLDTGTKPFGEFKIVKTFIHQGYTGNNSRLYDYAVIELETNVGDNLGWAGYEVATSDSTLNSGIIGYPGDKDEGTMWGVSCPVNVKGGSSILHRCDTFGGMSGSAVRYQDKMDMIFAIHTWGNSETNGGVALDQENFNAIKAWKNQIENEYTLSHEVSFEVTQDFDKLLFRNDCYQSVNIAVHWLDLDDVWKTNYYELSPGQTAYLVDTRNRIYYFIGKGSDGAVWSGDYQIEDGEYTFNMIRGEISTSSWGTWTQILSCQ